MEIQDVFISAGKTSQLIEFALFDASGDLVDLGDLNDAYPTQIDYSYVRQGGTSVTSPNIGGGMFPGVWQSGSIARLAAGWYQFGLPNAAIAAGAESVLFRFYGATFEDCWIRIHLGIPAAVAAAVYAVAYAGPWELESFGAKLSGVAQEFTVATAAELAKVPKSDSTVSWNATALAAINAEVDTALNTAIPGTPTANSINERIAAMDDKLPSKPYLAGTANATGDIEAASTVGAFPAAALVNAPTGSTVTVSQTAAVGSIQAFNLETTQYGSPSLPITCSVSQQGDSHKFAIYPLDDFSAPISILGSSLCSVGASPYKTVTVMLDDAYTATAGVFSYILRNTTDDIDAARGTLRIRPASNLTST